MIGVDSAMRAYFVGAAYVLLCSCLLWSDGAAGLGHPAFEDQKIDVADVIWWLPPDTESLAVARGSFAMEAVEDDSKRDAEWFTRIASEGEIRRQFQAMPLELVFEMELDGPLRGETVRFAMEGMRHFRRPTPRSSDSLVMDFEGCSIVVFEKELGAAFLAAQEKRAARSLTVAGTRVLVIEQKDATVENFLAVPKPNVLLAANNLPYLTRILERVARREDLRAVPGELPEWRYVDFGAPYWGLRHYDRTQAGADPTSPLGKDRAFTEADPKSIGFTFEIDPKDSRRIVLTQISGDAARVQEQAKNARVVAEPQAGVRIEIQVTSPEPGVLQRIYRVDRMSVLDYVGLEVVMDLGRGIYF